MKGSSVLGLLKNFSGWTSAHAIPQIGAATNRCLRIFWIIFSMICVAMFSYLGLYIVFSRYFQYPVTVDTSLKFEERPFPAITVCNMNPFKNSELYKDPSLEKLMDDFSLALANSSNVNRATDEWGFANVEKYLTIVKKAREHQLFISRQMQTEKLMNLSYSLRDVVLECAYEQSSCDFNRDWKTVYDPTYGACFQFNNEIPAIYTNTRNGPLNGLELKLSIDQSEFLPTTEMAGAKITIHEQGRHPFPEAFGYVAGNGLSVNFAITYEEMRRMPAPYGDCTMDKEGISPFTYEGIYTTEACIRSCIQAYVVEDCGCADPLIALPDGASFCNVTKESCVRKFDLPQAGANLENIESVNFTYDYCNCPQSCNEVSFGVVMGAGRWPADFYTPNECYNTTKWNSQVNCIKWYHENTVKLNIYYEKMDFTLYQESPEYTLTQILYDLGGQIGLWLGFSGITVVEFLALSILIMMLCSASHNGPELSTEVKKHMAYETKEDQEISKVMKESEESSSSSSDSSSSSAESQSSTDSSTEDEQ